MAATPSRRWRTPGSASRSQPGLDDVHVAPLLCAGLIGYRALRLAGEAPRIGFYGFGASAHLLAQVVVAQGRELFAFTRDGDTRGQAFARERGAVWAGGSSETPPVKLDAAIVFASAGELVVRALEALAPGGTVVCAGIHMSDIPSFPYESLWEERSIRSVANLTREDGREFLPLADAARGQARGDGVPARAGERGAPGAARGTLHRRRGPHHRVRHLTAPSESQPAEAEVATAARGSRRPRRLHGLSPDGLQRARTNAQTESSWSVSPSSAAASARW